MFTKNIFDEYQLKQFKDESQVFRCCKGKVYLLKYYTYNWTNYQIILHSKRHFFPFFLSFFASFFFYKLNDAHGFVLSIIILYYVISLQETFCKKPCPFSLSDLRNSFATPSQ